MYRFGRNLGGRIPSCPRHVRHDAVSMATAVARCRCPATAHCTFSSYGRLEAERVNQFSWNLVHNSKVYRNDSHVIKLKFKMADGRHVEKYSKCYNSPNDGPNGTQLGWSHFIVFPTCPPLCGCHGNSRCLATAHWTFSNYGRLEAERLNEFWWNLVHSSNLLGPQWQSRDQILKFLNFKMAETAAMFGQIFEMP